MNSEYDDTFSIEVSSAPCVLVIFGATGDLAKRKLYPSLLQLYKLQLLPDFSRIVGCGRTPLDTAAFQQLVCGALSDCSETAAHKFIQNFSYIRTDPADPATFQALKQHLQTLDHNGSPVPLTRLFDLAVPPATYPPLIAALSEAGLLTHAPNQPHPHVLLEKPFGSDSQTAHDLDAILHRYLSEDQIYRIDHYLGKETVQNILVLRFANALFGSLWNNTFIDNIQITVAETLGVEHRAAFYDHAGVLRDMFQNHLMELLALVTMEQPAALTADAIHACKRNVLAALRPIPLNNLDTVFVQGQYSRHAHVSGYREEPGIDPRSRTPTFAALKCWIDTPRWQNVPIYLRSGKRLASRASTIAIQFKHTTQKLFGMQAANVLTLRIQPNEGISLSLLAKKPGPKNHIGRLPLTFNYSDLGDTSHVPDAYARILLDAMLHDHTLFVRNDTIQTAWNYMTPLIHHVERTRETLLHIYPAKSSGPEAAHDLLTRDGRHWHTPLI